MGMKLSHIDYVSIKVVLLTALSIFAIPFYFMQGGTIFEFIAVLLVIKVFGTCGTIGSHRWLCHNSFTPTPIGKFLMMTGLLFGGYGKPVHVVIAHRLHHANVDNELDPHSPKFKSFLSLWLGRYTVSKGIRVPKEFLRRKDLVFFNTHYWKIYVAFNIVLALIDLKTALLFCPFLFAWSWFLNTCINYHGHKDVGTNEVAPRNLNKFMIFMTNGEGLHKNHHNNPNSYSFESADEKDISGWIIDRLLKSRIS
jgi:stearoyl-CoA desaturase (delta-9 desaturase)